MACWFRPWVRGEMRPRRDQWKEKGRGSSPSSLTSALARVALATCCVLLASAENFGLSLCLLLVSLQGANYRDQSREKGECQHMCLFEMQMTLRKGNNCCGSCKIKKKKNRKTSDMLLQAHVAPLAWTLLIQLQKMNIMRVPGLLGQINLRHPFCAAGWKIFLAS